MLKKRFALILVSVVLFGIVSKSNMIVLTDGTTMQVHNVEVSPHWIFYTETSGDDADIKKISIDKVSGYKIGDNPTGKYSTGKNNIELFEPFYFYNKTWSEDELRRSIKYEVAENLTVINDQKLQKIADDPQATAKSLNVRKWTQTDFTPENTPKKIGRIITYSKSPNYESFISLPVNLYMRGIFGVTVNTNVDVALRIPSYDDKNFSGIVDNEHFIVGRGYVKDK